jgi:NADH-quinone oxidoreductase subunit L
MFHLVTHACFKALLFLAAGAVIHSLGGERDLRRMGGLRRRLPLAFWSFLAGAASLAALPLVTAGFYSKSAILEAAWGAGPGGAWLWTAGVAGAFLTALYVFRALFLVFLGSARTEPTAGYGPAMATSMVALAALALGGGWIDVPGLLRPGSGTGIEAGGWGLARELVATGLSLLGVLLAGRIALGRGRPAAPPALSRFARGGLGFDALYERLAVRPFLWLAAAWRDDPLDRPYRGIAAVARGGHRLLSRNQTGSLRWYAAATAVGALLVLGAVAWAAGAPP